MTVFWSLASAAFRLSIYRENRQLTLNRKFINYPFEINKTSECLSNLKIYIYFLCVMRTIVVLFYLFIWGK